MRVAPDAAERAIAELRPIEGQIHELTAMLESGQDCEEVIAQLATAARALHRVGFRLLATQLQQCLVVSSSSDDRGRNLEQLERLFLSLP